MAFASFLLGLAAGSALALLISDTRDRRRAVSQLRAARERRMRTLVPSRRIPSPAPIAAPDRSHAPSAETLQLAGLVHELRTPLAAIRAYAELLATAATDRQFLEEASAILVEEAERLDGLIAKHLDRVRGSAPGRSTAPPLHGAGFDVGAVARAARELLRPLAANLGLDIEIEEGSPAIEARGDRALVRQILANLLGNALKHATGGALVRVRWMRAGEEVWLEVEDDGAGLRTEDAARLFEPFCRDEKAAGEDDGHGLGLWVAREFARACGGELEAPARPPGARGALFRLRLALATPAPERAKLGVA